MLDANWVNYLIFTLWFFSAVFDYTELTYFWQLKEYRVDRFRDFLSTRKGHLLVFQYSIFWRAILAVLLLLWPINDDDSLDKTILVLLAVDFFNNFYKIIVHKFKRPKLTFKALGVLFFSILLEAVFLFFSKDLSSIFLMLAVRFFLIAIIVQLLHIFTNQIRRYYIYLATKKMKQYPHLIVVGVTGSFGKTSVKEFLYHILSGEFKVIRIPKNLNSDIGITRFILKHDFSKDDIFIVEIGAYKRGDVKLICDIVNPRIGILTTIIEQHLALFGTIENIQATKYELLRSLPKDGLAITNSDNKYCREFLSELISEVQTFGTEAEHKPTCLITNIRQNSFKGISFDSIMHGINLTINASVPGIHNYWNIVPCILTALHLGMDMKKIKEQCNTLKLPEGVLNIYEYGNCTILDDSHNSNPEGFRSAIELLSTYPSNKRKIVITRGMLELGERSDELHENIGGDIALAADELVLISRDFEQSLRKGLVDKYRTEIKIIDEPEKLLQYIKDRKNDQCVILIENRVADIIHQELNNK